MNRLCIVALFLTVVTTVSISQDYDFNHVTAIETEIGFWIILNEALYSLAEPRRHHPKWPKYGYDLSAVKEDSLCDKLNNRRSDFPIGDAALMHRSDTTTTYVGFMLPRYENEDDRTLSELCRLIDQELSTIVEEYESYKQLNLNTWYLVTDLLMPTDLQPDIRVQVMDRWSAPVLTDHLLR